MKHFAASMERIANAVARHGLHKVAAPVFARDGLVVPSEWTDASVGQALGTKIAKDMLDRREIAVGLVALAQLTR